MIKTGDLVVVHTKFQPFKHPMSIISALIRVFQWLSNGFKWEYAKWNHSEVVYVDWDGQVYLYGALSGGITKRLMREWHDPSKRICKVYREYDIQYTEATPIEVDTRIQTADHRKYDFASLLFFQVIYRLTFRKLWLGRKGDKADDKLYCSEFYGYVWKEKYPDWYTLSTSDILERGQVKEITHGCI